MWQKFSQQARNVVFSAPEEAKSHGQGFVSTEYLLLGLCREPETVASNILERCGTSLSAVRDMIEARLPSTEAKPGTSMTLTAGAKRAVDDAFKVAAKLRDRYIGPEHLLLGLLKNEASAASGALFKLGLTYEKALAAYTDLRDRA